MDNWLPSQFRCAGTYVEGTVDTNSYQYNGRSLTYSFASGTASGAGTIGFGFTQNNGDINPLGLSVIQAVGRQTNGMYGLMGAFAGGSVLAGAGVAYGAYAGGTGLIALEVASPTGAAVIFRTQQLAHAMRSAPGHNTPVGTVEAIKSAVNEAVKAGSYTVGAGGVVKGTTQIQGVAHEFTGFLRTTGEIVFSNIYRK